MLIETKKYTFEDFLKFYERTGERGGFEFAHGQIWDKYAAQALDESLVDYILSDEFDEKELPVFTMPTQFHDLIITNLLFLLLEILRSKGYISYSQKTAIPKKEETEKGYREPDIIVVNKKNEQRNKLHQVINPIMLVEVLSKATEKIDLIDKLEEYQKIPSVQVYMLVWQEKPKVLIYSRKEEFIWEERIYEGLEKIAFVPFFEIEIPLNKIYEDITFDTRLP
ncbi:MAG: hypothetical protein OHK0045_01680 [Raineya sp.]